MDDTYKCEFKTNGKNHYECLLVYSILPGSSKSIGEHFEGKTNNDVKSISFSWITRNIPENFLIHFPNIKFINLYHMNLAILKEKQFEKSVKVEEFSGIYNEIEEIGANAFDFAPNLKN